MSMDKQYLKDAARVIEAKLPDNHGFILLVAPYGEGDGQRMTYISSLRREDAVAMLKEFLIQASGPAEWMKHIK